MKRILILIIGLIGVAQAQYSPTSAKTRFVNGLALGTKLDSYFNAADSNAIYWRADSVVMAKYKGAARSIQFSENLSYVTLEMYGGGVGVANNTTALNAALATKKTVLIGKGVYAFTTKPSDLTEGASIIGLGDSSVLYTTQDSTLFNIAASNIRIQNLTIKGNGRGTATNYATTRPNQIGIRAVGNTFLTTNYSNILIENVHFQDIGGAAVYSKDLVGTSYQGSLKLQSCIADGNTYIGFQFDTRSEYNVLNNCFAFNCQYGIRMKGGNNNVIGGQYNSNRVGFLLEGGIGINDAHSSVTAATINHNLDYGVIVDSVQLGHLFNGNNIYVNDVLVRNSNGIIFSNNFFGIDTFFAQNSNSIKFNLDSFTTNTAFMLNWNGTNNSGTASSVYWFNNGFQGGNPSGVVNSIYNLDAYQGYKGSYFKRNAIPYVLADQLITTDSTKIYFNGTSKVGFFNNNPSSIFSGSSNIGNIQASSTLSAGWGVKSATSGTLEMYAAGSAGEVGLISDANVDMAIWTNYTKNFLFTKDAFFEAVAGVRTKKIIGNSSTPSISGGSATYIGTGASTGVSGNDMAGEITLVTGTGCSSTGASNRSALTVTFASAYSTAPIVQIQAIQQGGLSSTDGPTNQTFFLRRDAVGTSGFTVYLPIGVTLTDSTTYLITYQVIGR